MPIAAATEHGGEVPPVSAQAVAGDDPPNGIDRVRVMLADSEARIHATVESIRSDLTSLEREVAVLASRSDDVRGDLEQFSGKFDNLAEQVHKLMGALEAKAAAAPPPAPPQPAQPAQEARDAQRLLLSVINERTITAAGLVALALALAITLYASRFGDEAVDRKLDRFPGTQRSEPAR